MRAGWCCLRTPRPRLPGVSRAPAQPPSQLYPCARGAITSRAGLEGENPPHSAHGPSSSYRLTNPTGTKQVCFFRDSHADLTKTGLAIYGLSADSAKANTTFRTKHELPYPLLCDPAASLIAAIGLKKEPKGTQRGVFVVDKAGKVLAAQAGSPDGTVGVVRRLVEEGADGKDEEDGEDGEDEEKKE